MEICELKPVERAVEIKHPSTGDDLGIMVTLVSMNDPRMSAIKRRIRVQRLEQERRGKTINVDDVEKNEIDLLIGAMTGWIWSGDTTFKGSKPEFNEKNIKEVFKELPWFKEQIAEALGGRKRFFSELKDKLVEAVRVYTRYDLVSENDETRREKYERMGKFVPNFEVPISGVYLWEWFGQLCRAVHRIDFNGNYCVIGPSEIFAWSNLTNNLITPTEYDILTSMDVVYCDELNKEVQARHAKEEDKRKREMDAAKARSRIRRR